MREVSQFEANLIRILRCIVSGSPPDGILEIVRQESPRPKCLSRDCVELAKDALRKGMTRLFAELGWKRERFLSGDAELVVEGRLWQRVTADSRQLEFSGAVLDLLLWLTALPLPGSKKKCSISYEDCSLGDRLFFLLTFQTFHGSPVCEALSRQAVFQSHPLVALGFPVATSRTNLQPASGLESWFEPDCAWVLESWQDKLRDQWLQLERAKAGEPDWKVVLTLGELQQQLLDDCFEAAEKTRRWDLVRFVLNATAAALSEIDYRQAVNQRDLTGLKMTQRQEIRSASLTLLRNLDRLSQHQEQERLVGFYDDGYDASQLWKSDWERCNGDAVCREASEIEQSLTALAAT